METNTFKDAKGRVWNCHVTWGAIRRSAAADCDLSLVEELLGDFHRGSIKLVDALWCVIEPQAKRDNVTREDFEEQLCSDFIDEAREALLGGLRDFFPSDRANLIAAANDEVKSQMRNLLASQKPSIESPGVSA